MAVGGMLVGVVLAGTLAASAADNNAAAGRSGAYGVPGYGAANGGSGRHGGGPRGNVDESKSRRPDEHLLTGDTAAKVKAAALAKYPRATVLRVETDSDGVYEAHLTTSGGKRVTVEVDKSFKVTGEESGRAIPEHRCASAAGSPRVRPLAAGHT